MATVVPAPQQNQTITNLMQLIMTQQLGREGLEAEKEIAQGRIDEAAASREAMFAIQSRQLESRAREDKFEADRQNRVFSLMDQESRDKLVTSQYTRNAARADMARVNAQSELVKQQTAALSQATKRTAQFTMKEQNKFELMKTILPSYIKALLQKPTLAPSEEARNNAMAVIEKLITGEPAANVPVTNRRSPTTSARAKETELVTRRKNQPKQKGPGIVGELNKDRKFLQEGIWELMKFIGKQNPNYLLGRGRGEFPLN